jgi:hypothetical protein
VSRTNRQRSLPMLILEGLDNRPVTKQQRMVANSRDDLATVACSAERLPSTSQPGRFDQTILLGAVDPLDPAFRLAGDIPGWRDSGGIGGIAGATRAAARRRPARVQLNQQSMIVGCDRFEDS